MTTIDKTRPFWSLSLWKNAQGDLFAQLEGGSVHKFPLTEGGLSKALKLIPAVETQPGFLSGGQNIIDKVMRNKKAKVARKEREKRKVQPLSETEQQRMASITKRWSGK